MTGRIPLERSPEDEVEERRFLALYGAWDPLEPAAVARELVGFDRPWWVVGGWAIEAATGLRREHEDTDVSILACDVPAFVDHLRDRWHVWNNVGGVLRPLGGRWTTVDEPDSQLWVRADAVSPWVLDVPLTPDADGRWTHRRVPGLVAEVEAVTSVADDGIRYLDPELVLLYKARSARPKDDLDLEATLPVLTPERRDLLRDWLRDLDPDHRWLERLERD